jgi:hypothetical protein
LLCLALARSIIINTHAHRPGMDFDGSTRKRTVVSLRGKSKEEDAKELLRRARAEREARAAEKRRAAAAAAVLRFYRQRYVWTDVLGCLLLP